MSDDVYRQEMDRAEWLVDAGQYERAMQILTRLLVNYPDEAGSTYIALAAAHNSVNRLEDSEAAARRAVAALPDSPDAHRLLACSLIDQDREPEAERSLRTALDLAPESSTLFHLMAIAMAGMEREEEALFYAREAVRLSPVSADHHALLAQLQMDTDAQAAEASLQEALALEPAHDGALLQLAQLHQNRRDHVGAAKAAAAYAAQTSDPLQARAAVDTIFFSTVLVLHLGALACSLLMLMSAAFVWLVKLPTWLLLLPLALCATLTFRAVGRRVQALRIAFAGRGRIMMRSFIRRQRLTTAWALLLLLMWTAFGVGTIQLLMGGVTILAGALGAGLLLLIGSWIFARLRVN